MSHEVRRRIGALDVIRGFALCGILLANVQPIAGMGGMAVPGARANPADALLGLLVEQRFFPIFSLLFGIGFSLLLGSAGERTARPRVLLARRLLALLAMGLAHRLLLWEGDILTVYAVVGLVVLLPSTWLPRWAVAGLAFVLLASALVLAAGPFALVPGLFLLGSALTRYGVVGRIEGSTWVPATLGLVLAVLAVPVVKLQVEEVRFDLTLALAGLLIAGVAPLGRMALTNYLTATVLVLVAARLVGGVPQQWSTATVLVIAGVILLVQWVWSTFWLNRHLQGPIEWLWRWVTWARRPASRTS